MKELIERIEGAEGPSYALDCEIWDAIYPGERQARFNNLTAKGQPYHLRLGPADMDGYVKPLRSFTASLDAAMTLVPEGRSFSIEGPVERFKGDMVDAIGYTACLFCEGSMRWHDEDTTSFAATPALALAAAALKARGE